MSPTSSKPWCSSSPGGRLILELRPLASSSALQRAASAPLPPLSGVAKDHVAQVRAPVGLASFSSQTIPSPSSVTLPPLSLPVPRSTPTLPIAALSPIASSSPFPCPLALRAALSPTSSKPWCSSSPDGRLILELRPLASSSALQRAACAPLPPLSGVAKDHVAQVRVPVGLASFSSQTIPSPSSATLPPLSLPVLRSTPTLPIAALSPIASSSPFPRPLALRAALSPTSSKPWCSSSPGGRLILELRPLASSSALQRAASAPLPPLSGVAKDHVAQVRAPVGLASFSSQTIPSPSSVAPPAPASPCSARPGTVPLSISHHQEPRRLRPPSRASLQRLHRPPLPPSSSA
nr:flocculation protein FLO11-like [Lolium perenne]